MTTHEKIMELVQQYEQEVFKFEQKAVKAAGARARKVLSELSKLLKLRRAEIQEAKMNMKK